MPDTLNLTGCVEHRRRNHPDEPVMSYEEFFRDRHAARYAVGSGRFRGCC